MIRRISKVNRSDDDLFLGRAFISFIVVVVVDACTREHVLGTQEGPIDLTV